MSKKNEKYEGLGFVELIISIGIAGIALMVLITMASNSMRQAVRHERHDALTRLALDGALVVRKHSEKVNDLRVDGYDFNGVVNTCYGIDFENSSVVFTEPYDFESISQEVDLRTKIIYGDEGENKLGDVYYVAYCINAIEPSGDLLETYIGKVVTGYVECRGCGIEPYEHNMIISIKKVAEI
jgi:hypothetical protein